VVSQVCEQTAVLYLGKIAEVGPTDVLLRSPAHPYTRALRSAVPEVEAAGRRTRVVLPGDPPDAANPPSGCVFHPRCPLAVARCRTEPPVLRDIGPGRQVACHRAEDVMAGLQMPTHRRRPAVVQPRAPAGGQAAYGDRIRPTYRDPDSRPKPSWLSLRGLARTSAAPSKMG
jgi:oligopeptide/dipeptide ABC transporter ATP-binding protein